MSVFTDMKIWAHILLRKKKTVPTSMHSRVSFLYINNEVYRHRKVEGYISKESVSR